MTWYAITCMVCHYIFCVMCHYKTKLRYLPLPRIPALRVVYHALLLQMAYVDREVMKQLSYATFVCKSNDWWGNVHSIIND